jgi:hypothetical protein
VLDLAAQSELVLLPVQVQQQVLVLAAQSEQVLLLVLALAAQSEQVLLQVLVPLREQGLGTRPVAIVRCVLPELGTALEAVQLPVPVQ